MYLLLVENNFIASREIKGLLDKYNINCEIINCSSNESLLDIAEKLSPDILIIDFDFYLDDPAELVRKLRQYSNNAYILAFIDPDHFEKLHLAIEMGIDDYMVKPLQRDDVMLRIKMGLQRKNIQPRQTVEEVNVSNEKETMLNELEEVFFRQNISNEEAPVSSENMKVKSEQPGENEFTEAQTYTDSAFESPEPVPEEDDHGAINSPAISFLETQSSTEKTEEDAELTFDEYDDLEELFGIQSEPEQEQTNINNLQADPEIQHEPSFVDDNNRQKVPERELDNEYDYKDLLTGENESDYELTDEKSESDSQPLADFFNEWPDSAESEETAAESAEEELDAASITEPDLQPDPELVPENDPYLFEESAEDPDDKELFGIKQNQRTVDTKSFEELFARKNEFEAKNSRLSNINEAGKSKVRQEKHFFFAKKAQGTISLDSSKEAEKHGPAKDWKNADSPKGAKNGRFAKVAGILTISVFLLLITLSILLIQASNNGGG